MVSTVENVRRLSHRLLSLSTIWTLIVPAGLFVLLARTVVFPNDYWWHMRTGQIILQEGYIPTTDRFSFTRYGAPWVNQAWLMQVFFYIVYTLGGLPWTILAHALIITTGYVLLLRAIVPKAGIRPAVLATAVGAGVGAFSWGVRPQSISFLLFGILVTLIEHHRRGQERALWGTIPLFLLWANAHGGFVFGIAVMGVYVLGQIYTCWRERALRKSVLLSCTGLLPFIGALLALSVNPQGPLGLIRYVLGFLTSKVTVAANMEFSPINIRQGDGLVFWGSALLFLFALLRSDYRPTLDQSVTLLLFAGLTLWARRISPWYGFVLIPPLAAAIAAWWHPPETIPPGKPALNALIIGFLLLAMFLSLPWWRGRIPYPLAPRSFVSATTPVQATRVLCENAPEDARVYQYQAFGAYQIWACPRLKVFVDTRIELYTADIWRDYFKIEAGRFDWQDVADRYRLTHLFLSPDVQRDAIDAAQASDCWQPFYGDAHAVIFVRTCPSTQATP